MELNIAIKQTLESRGIKQKKIAEILCCDPATVSRFLSGNRKIKIEELQKISSFLDVDFSTLLR